MSCGAFAVADDLTVIDCEFVGNQGISGPGGLTVSGDQILVSDSEFRGNRGGRGGGMNGYGSILRCVFEANEAVVNPGDPLGTGFGGAIMCGFLPTVVSECVMFDNTAETAGGAIEIRVDDLEVQSCTFSGNSSPLGAHLSVGRVSTANALIQHSILAFGDGQAVACVSGSSVVIACSDVFANTGGDWIDCLSGQQNLNGNFWADPRFCDPTAGDFTIQVDSPCAPPGLTGCGLVGALPVACGPVALSAESWGSVKSRFRDVD